MSNPFDRNPYRVPPPWNTGYALPQNVDDEGLRRHAYTTAWAPRGSFDNPSVGTAGYAVPSYVVKEGYGQGAFVTKWAPRATYYGPKIPHWIDEQASKVVGAKKLPGGAVKMQIDTLAGTEAKATGGATPFANYGLTSAAALIETVKMMPPDMRTAQLRKALDQIDPTLYARAEKLAEIEAKAGVPALVALERGIGAAMSTGISKEIIELGRGKYPAKQTQLGAVCYSCFAALGDAAPTSGGDAMFKIGPFMIPRGKGKATWKSGSITDEQKHWLRECGLTTAHAYKDAGWKNFNLRGILNNGEWPLVKFTVTPEMTQSNVVSGMKVGEEWAFYTKGKTYEYGEFEVILAPYKAPKDPTKKSMWQRAWSAIKKAVVAVVNFAKDAARWVADKACKLIGSPVGQVAAAAAGAAAGAYMGGSTGAQVGAQVGAAGAQIAAQACGPKAKAKDEDRGPPPQEEKKSNVLPLLLLGGAGVAAYAMTRKK